MSAKDSPAAFGPAPSQQASWDWRAAGNFICGGAVAGLIVFTVLSGAEGLASMVLLAAGMALVGTGLMCVWFELGRPFRALHVFFNPRTSWMTREAFTATLLFPAVVAAAFGMPGLAPVAAVLALVFVYCQSRMVQAARGIPAWREPLVSPLLVLTGLVEGGGLFLLASLGREAATGPLPLVFGVLVVLRAFVWLAYRRRLAASAAPRALVHLDRAGRALLWIGTGMPLVLVLVGIAPGAGGASAILGAAGLAAALAGAYMKLTLVTRAGFNQGFVLAHLPVRGAPHYRQR